MHKAGQIEKKITEKPEDMKRSCDILGMYKKNKIEDDKIFLKFLLSFYHVKKDQQKTKCGKI